MNRKEMKKVPSTSDRTLPLHKAVSEKNIKLVVDLLAKGEKVNAKDFEGNTPLHLVARDGNKKNSTSSTHDEFDSEPEVFTAAREDNKTSN